MPAGKKGRCDRSVNKPAVGDLKIKQVVRDPKIKTGCRDLKIIPAVGDSKIKKGRYGKTASAGSVFICSFPVLRICSSEARDLDH